MRYLFGDSSESVLETNYLAFLREAIDFGVVVLQADAGLSRARERRVNQLSNTEAAARAVEELGQNTLLLTEPLAVGDDPVNRCAAAIVRATTEAVKREAGRARSGTPAELDKIDAEIARWQAQCATALCNLLATYDLPDAVETLTVQWTGSGYEARLCQRVAFGAEVTLTLDVPDGSLFAQTLYVEQITGTTEAHAPEPAGSLDEIKLVPQSQLGGHHVTAVIVASGAVTVRLRAGADDDSNGYDVLTTGDGDVKIERVGGQRSVVDDHDVSVLRDLTGKLANEVRGLRTNRRMLVEATLDGKPLATDEPPRGFVERLIEAMAPVVREIASHSLSSTELVLKRLIGEDRREELFLSRTELARKLAPLPAELRHVFGPFGIFDDAIPGAAQGEVDLDERDEPSIVIEAELPPRSATQSGRRSIRKHSPPPPPPRRPGALPTESAVTAALREIAEDSEATRDAVPASPKDSSS